MLAICPNKPGPCDDDDDVCGACVPGAPAAAGGCASVLAGRCCGGVGPATRAGGPAAAPGREGALLRVGAAMVRRP